jgi:hypothetical protein
VPNVINSETVSSCAGKKQLRQRDGEKTVRGEVEPFERIADAGRDDKAPHGCRANLRRAFLDDSRIHVLGFH